MNAQSLILTVMSYKATTTCKTKNMELVLEELKSMKASKIAPKRLLNRAIKIAERQLQSA